MQDHFDREIYNMIAAFLKEGAASLEADLQERQNQFDKYCPTVVAFGKTLLQQLSDAVKRSDAVRENLGDYQAAQHSVTVAQAALEAYRLTFASWIEDTRAAIAAGLVGK
jgi:hypothetical protein